MATTTTAPATRKKRETWLDWWFSDRPEAKTLDEMRRLGVALVTRDELVEHVRARGADVRADNIRSWEHLGILPQGVRRWHNGATRTLYPDTYMVPLILRLRELQRVGVPLAAIAPELRDQFLRESMTRKIVDDAEATEVKKEAIRSLLRRGLPGYIVDALSTVASFWESANASPTVRMDLSIHSEEGTHVDYSLHRTPDGRWSVGTDSDQHKTTEGPWPRLGLGGTDR